MSENSFDARGELKVGGRTYDIYRLEALQSRYDVARLPFSLKILLENVLRNEDGVAVRSQDVEALVTWDHRAEPSQEIAFTPARVLALLHDVLHYSPDRVTARIDSISQSARRDLAAR